MNPDQIAFGRDLFGARLRLGNRFAVKHHGGAAGFGRLDLHERRRHRHDDSRRYAEAAGVISHGLGVIAGRHGDHAAAALGGRKRRELDVGATFLERIGDLQILVFYENLGAGERRERRRRKERCAQHLALDDTAGGFDIGKRHHAGLFPHFRQRYNVRIV
jgi:hypothetical protein